MLNYIWTALIALSLVFALGSDFSDLRHDRYRNGGELPVTLKFSQAGSPASAVGIPVSVGIEGDTLRHFYHVDAPASLAAYSGVLLAGENHVQQLRFAKDPASLPAPLNTIRDLGGGDAELVADVVSLKRSGDTATALVRFKPIRFVKLRAIAKAATDFAQVAITVAIGLIGVLSLWLGLMRIGEKSGLIDVVVKVIQPVLRPLFPEIPAGHPALGMIALNLSAGMLGLGNAGTPFGIKAMEELQKLNKTTDTATNPMIMLLAINTALIQLVPPGGLVAVIGLAVSRIYFPIVATTGCGMLVAILATKLLSKLPAFSKTNPDLRPAPTAPIAAEA